MRRNIHSLVLGLVAAALGASCGDGDDSSYLDRFSCDPYEQPADPIQLVSILVVAQNDAGTVYVVDETGLDLGFRLFVSQGNTLVRKDLVNAIHENAVGGSERYFFTVLDSDYRYTLVVEVDGLGDSEIATVPGEYQSSISDAGEDSELLTVLDQSSIASMELANLPGSVKTEYLAESGGENSLVIARPWEYWELGDFRVFFGPDDKMIERPVTEVFRDDDGGSFLISFLLDSTDAQAYFSWENTGWGETYLKIGEEEIALTRLNPESEDMGQFSFYCIQ